MNLVISQTQSSNHASGTVYLAKTNTLNIRKPILTIGRNQLEEEGTFNIGSKSISGKHMSLTFPPQLFMPKQRVFYPSYLSKIRFSLILPKHLLLKIREYYTPQELLCITDLNSRYGLFLSTKWIKINSHKVFASQVQSKLDKRVDLIDTDKKIIVQFGNECIQIEEIKKNLQKQELENYFDQIKEKLGNQSINIIVKQKNFMPQDKPTFNTILLKQVFHQANIQKQLYFLLCNPSDCMEKFLVGRNSLCDIQLNKSSISRKQACIFSNKEGEWILEDNNSMNGLWIKLKKMTYRLDQHLFPEKYQFSLSLENSDNFSMVLSESTKIQSKPLTLKLGEVKLDLKLEREKYRDQQSKIQEKIYPSILSQIQQFMDIQNGELN